MKHANFYVDYCRDDDAIFTIVSGEINFWKSGSQEISYFLQPWGDSNFLELGGTGHDGMPWGPPFEHLLYCCFRNEMKFNNCQTPVLGLGLGADFTFTWDNNKNNHNDNHNDNNNPHLNFLEGTVLGDKT